MKYLLLSFASLSFFAACNNNSVTENNTGKVAETATIQSAAPPAPSLPSFSIVNDKGQVLDLAQYKGKSVFVNLWATWCAPCRAEIPSIQKLYAKTDKNKAVFVMLSLDNDFETAKQFAEKTKLGLPIYYPASNLPTVFNVTGIPATFIFNEKGELIHHQDGAADYDTKHFSDLLNQ
ncbi:MAG: TlpA disulfide reductase family protein [Bacteroidota bacterium]